MKQNILPIIITLVSCGMKAMGLDMWFRSNPTYTWPRHDDKYDCVVGISYGDLPVCTGHILSRYIVITSATPLEAINNHSNLYVHVIAGSYDESVNHTVKYVQYQSERPKFLNDYPLPEDTFRQSIHDIALITLEEHLEVYTKTENYKKDGETEEQSTVVFDRFPNIPRHYRMKPIINVKKFDTDGWFSMAGHGFIDRGHVKYNFNLEVIHYKVGNVLDDCDHWILRSWGHFICLSNIEKFVGITAGAPLYYNYRLVGLGAFSVSIGDESILVFTDLRKYTGLRTAGNRSSDVVEDNLYEDPEHITFAYQYDYDV